MYPIQRPKIGFLVKDVSSSELVYNILRRGSDADIDTFLFFENIARPCITSLVPCCHLSDAFTFDGPLVATCLNTASKLIEMYGTTSKFFFINDLEWMRIPFNVRQYNQLEQIYRNNELQLICRSENHEKLIRFIWNRTSFVVPNYNFYEPEILNKLRKQECNIYPSQSQQKPIIFKNSVL